MQKNIPVMLGTIVVIGAAIFGGIWWFIQATPISPVATQEQATTTSEVSPKPAPIVAVAGMSKYTDTEFGFSFWYPSTWSVIKLPMASTDKVGNFVTERLMVREGENVEIDIDKVHSNQMTYNVNPGACGYCGKLSYFFDLDLHMWMKIYPDAPTVAPAPIPGPADVSHNTMGGLHMFSSEQKENAVIIPLSAMNFLFVNGVTYTAQCGPACGDPSVQGDANFLASTILATDPNVATPVSVDQQISTIKAEQAAYSSI